MVDALNTIEAVLAVIPVTAVFSPLVDILVAGIETAMSAFWIGDDAVTGSGEQEIACGQLTTLQGDDHFAQLCSPDVDRSLQGAMEQEGQLELGLQQAQIA